MPKRSVPTEVTPEPIEPPLPPFAGRLVPPWPPFAIPPEPLPPLAKPPEPILPPAARPSEPLPPLATPPEPELPPLALLPGSDPPMPEVLPPVALELFPLTLDEAQPTGTNATSTADRRANHRGIQTMVAPKSAPGQTGPRHER